MNTDDLDRAAYSEWWESEGRLDESFCPCGNPAEDIVLERDLVADEIRIEAGPGFCPRHRFDRTGVTREQFAERIMAGSFSEGDLTEEEERKASLIASGFVGGKPN